MQNIDRRWNYIYTKNHEKGALECFCDCENVSCCRDCEQFSTLEICSFKSHVDRKKTSKIWDTIQKSEFIRLLESAIPFIPQREAEAIWATVVLRQAYDVANCAVNKGFTSFECDHHCDEDDEKYIPYDASRWASWIKSTLSLYEKEDEDVSIDNNHIWQVHSGGDGASEIHQDPHELRSSSLLLVLGRVQSW